MFFIVGRGRSGTTLLGRMLGMNANIHITPEGLFVLDLHKKYGNLTAMKWTQQKIWQFVNDVQSFNRMGAWKLDTNQLVRKLCDLNEYERNYMQICQRVYSYHAAMHEKNACLYLGDKNPLYSRYLSLLQEIFPQAKFIYLVRNVKDNILSFQEVYFDMDDTGSLAWRWKKYNQEIQKQMKLFPHRYQVTAYENLVTNGEQELRRITDFLGVSFDPIMLDLVNKPADRITQLSWHKNLTRELSTKSIDKWKLGMSKEDIDLVDFITSPSGQLSSSVSFSIRIKAFLSFLKTQIYSFLEIVFFRLPLSFRARLSNRLRNSDKR